MAHERGSVWWGPAPHKSSPSYRPWVVVSDDSHPFADTECIALAMTTKQHTRSIAVPDDEWVSGGSKKDAYISPWYTTTLKLRDFDRKQGVLDPALVDEATASLGEYVLANRE